jgi:hypothetical protein
MNFIKYCNFFTLVVSNFCALPSYAQSMSKKWVDCRVVLEFDCCCALFFLLVVVSLAASAFLSVHCYCGGADGWPWEEAVVIEHKQRIRTLPLVVVDCYVAGSCFILIVCCCCCGAGG